MSPFTTVIDKQVNDLFTESDWDVYIKENLNSGVVRPIADVILPSVAATIDITNIAADWAHLLLAVWARSDVAGINANLNVRFNADAGANYDSQLLHAAGTTPAAGELIAATSAQAGQIPGGDAPTGVFGPGMILIPSYAATVTQKALVSLGGLKWGTATGNVRMMATVSFRRNAAAITQLTLFPSLSNFAASTRVTCYGMGGIV